MSVVGVEEVLASPERWDGRTAAVSGILEISTENTSINAGPNDLRSLWLVLGDIERSQIQSLDKQQVVVEGIIELRRRGHFGMFPGQITHVSRIIDRASWLSAPA